MKRSGNVRGSHLVYSFVLLSTAAHHSGMIHGWTAIAASCDWETKMGFPSSVNILSVYLLYYIHNAHNMHAYYTFRFCRIKPFDQFICLSQICMNNERWTKLNSIDPSSAANAKHQGGLYAFRHTRMSVASSNNLCWSWFVTQSVDKVFALCLPS